MKSFSRQVFFACGVVVTLSGLTACATKQQTGTLVGGVGGAFIGHQLTGGSALGTVGGAVAGGVAGNLIGTHMDEQDKSGSN